MTDDPDHTWRRIQDELRLAVPADTYDIWLAPLRAIELTAARAIVEAPQSTHAWIAERFARVITASACRVLGAGATLEVRAADGRAHGVSPTSPSVAPEHPEDAGGLNPKYDFGQFVIGDANRFAHAAALAVAELPGQAYNPLFIYGPPGVGKTHLLHSIGNYVREYGSGLTVRYATAEMFTNQFIAALNGGSIGRFKSRYRTNDVLLIDDVQFLASKARTEEEFFHTFNTLSESGSQLVLTSDRLPRDLNALEDRLLERFQAGLVTAIGAPGAEMRLTVLRKRVQRDAIHLDDDGVLDAISERVPTNLRALEGALIRVVAFASLTGRNLDRALAEEVLDGLHPAGRETVRRAAQQPSIDRVQRVTAEAFGLRHDELLSRDRSARVTWPRQVAMYLAREHTGETYPAIAEHFGGRNHTTVMHACRRTIERLATDADASETVRRLADLLGADNPDRRD